MDDQSLDRRRRPLRRVVRVVEQVARKQGTGAAKERNQWPGDDHRRVVERRDEEYGRRGGDDRHDPGGVDDRRPVILALIRPRRAAIGKQGAGSRGDRRHDRNTPEERIGRLRQRKRIGGGTSRCIDGQDEDDRGDSDADDQPQARSRLIGRLRARCGRTEIGANRRLICGARRFDRRRAVFAVVASSHVYVARGWLRLRAVNHVLPPPKSESRFHRVASDKSLRSCSFMR